MATRRRSSKRTSGHLRLVHPSRGIPSSELELPDQEACELLFLRELERTPDPSEVCDQLLTPEIEP